MNSFDFSCAEVLPSVGRGGGTDGIERAAEQGVDLVCSGNGGHDDGTEAVHSRLDQDAADGRDGVLQTHGQSHQKQLPGVELAEAQVLAV